MASLRPYQAELVARIGEAFRGGARCVAAVAPTGAGKTVMFSHTTAKYADAGKRTLIVAHRESLVHQAADKLRDSGIEHAIIRAGRATFHATTKVGMVGTVAKRTDQPDGSGYDLIHLDEGHHAVDGSAYHRIAEANPRARVIKWTASPERLDGRGLGRGYGGFADAIVEGPTVSSLMDGGYLVRASVFGPDPGAVPVLDEDKVGSSGEFKADYLESVLNLPKITGDAVAHYRKLCPGLPAVAFCCNVRHAEDVAATFRADGWNAAAVYGGMKGNPAKEIAKLGTGELHVITSCDLIGEGLDLPSIAVVIKLRATTSLALNVQWDGRPLRPLPGTGGDLAAIAASSKPRAFILDHAGNVWRHGWPETPRVWTLQGRNKKAKAEIQPRQCPTCFCMNEGNAPRCRECGHSFVLAKKLDEKPVAQLTPEQGELQALDPTRFEHLRDTPLAKLLPSEKRTIEQLKAIEVAKGYKEGWAEKQRAFKDAAYLKHRYGDRA